LGTITWLSAAAEWVTSRTFELAGDVDQGLLVTLDLRSGEGCDRIDGQTGILQRGVKKSAYLLRGDASAGPYPHHERRRPQHHGTIPGRLTREVADEDGGAIARDHTAEHLDDVLTQRRKWPSVDTGEGDLLAVEQGSAHATDIAAHRPAEIVQPRQACDVGRSGDDCASAENLGELTGEPVCSCNVAAEDGYDKSSRFVDDEDRRIG